MKRILNYSEEKAFCELYNSAERFGFKVYPKVRIADILPINNSGISDIQFKYALQAHFDFTVTDDNQMPLFSVEFDGPTHNNHKQIERDKIKNSLCKIFDYPILRISKNFISKKYRDLTLLSWIVDVYQLQIGFYEAQEKGLIPYDEPFDPFFICTSTSKNQYPYWISLDARTHIKKLHDAKKLKFSGSSGCIVIDSNEMMRGFEFIQINNNEGIYVKGRMQSQDFPIIFSDLFDELLSISLYEKVLNHFEGKQSLTEMSEIHQMAKKYQTDYTLLRSHSIGYAI